MFFKKIKNKNKIKIGTIVRDKSNQYDMGIVVSYNICNYFIAWFCGKATLSYRTMEKLIKNGNIEFAYKNIDEYVKYQKTKKLKLRAGMMVINQTDKCLGMISETRISNNEYHYFISWSDGNRSHLYSTIDILLQETHSRIPEEDFIVSNNPIENNNINEDADAYFNFIEEEID